MFIFTAASGDSAKVESLDRIMSALISEVFVHRFCDIDKGVRLSCIKALGDWVTLHPSMLANDQIYKHLVWSFNDFDFTNRDCAAQILQAILLQEQNRKKTLDKKLDEHKLMIQNLCDFILFGFKDKDNLDNIVDALFPIVPALGMWDKISEILSTYGDGDLKLAQFHTLSKMLQSSINIACGAGSRPGKKEDRYPRSFSLRKQALHFSVSFTEVVRRSQTDPALIAILATVPKGFKGQKIPTAAVPKFAELGSLLLDAIQAHYSASTCNQLAESAAACFMLGNSVGKASSRASVIAAEATKTKGKKSRSSTGVVDKHALMRSSALFRYFDIRESNVAQAALGVSLGDTEDEATKFHAAEVMFLHAIWSRISGDSGAVQWFGNAIEAACALLKNCSSPIIKAYSCALIYDCRIFYKIPGRHLTATDIDEKAYDVAASPDIFESPALQEEHVEEIRKMGLNDTPCGSNGKRVRLAVGRYVLFNVPEAVDDIMHLTDEPITAAACVAFQPPSADWLRSLRGEIKKKIGSAGLANWDSCLMEKMFTIVAFAQDKGTQDTLALQMELVCTKLAASHYNSGIPGNHQHNLFNQILSIVKRGLGFSLSPQQDNVTFLFLEYCLVPFVSKVPDECKKKCQVLVKHHVSQVIGYKLDANCATQVDLLLTALTTQIAAPIKTAAIAVKPATTAIKGPASASAKPAVTSKSATVAKPAVSSKGAAAKAAAPKSSAAAKKKDSSSESDSDSSDCSWVSSLKTPKSKPAAASKAATATLPKSKQAAKPGPKNPTAAKPVAKAAAGQKKPAKGKAKQDSDSESSDDSDSSDFDSSPVVASRATKKPRDAATKASERIRKQAMLDNDSYFET